MKIFRFRRKTTRENGGRGQIQVRMRRFYIIMISGLFEVCLIEWAERYVMLTFCSSYFSEWKLKSHVIMFTPPVPSVMSGRRTICCSSLSRWAQVLTSPSVALIPSLSWLRVTDEHYVAIMTRLWRRLWPLWPLWIMTLSLPLPLSVTSRVPFVARGMCHIVKIPLWVYWHWSVQDVFQACVSSQL